ncbi:MAG TPA: hypothetical protein VGL97_00285 [Bryobacteraceae bacterium]|jgi:hypothetical protein
MTAAGSDATRDNLVTIRTFMSEFEADITKAALEAFEIDCMLIRDDCGGQRPHLTMGAGIRLVVRSGDAKRAEDVLAGEAEESS